MQEKIYDSEEFEFELNLYIKSYRHEVSLEDIVKALRNVTKDNSRILGEIKKLKRDQKRSEHIEKLEGMKHRNCENCGVSFSGRNLKQIYCNATCNNAAFWKKRKGINAS